MEKKYNKNLNNNKKKKSKKTSYDTYFTNIDVKKVKKITKKQTTIKKKINAKRIILLILLMILIAVFLFNMYKIFLWFKDNKNIDTQIDQIEDIVKIEEVSTTEEDIIEEEKIVLPSLYETYKNTNMMDVDFSKLKSYFPAVVGWINVSGTTINYPFVQTTDNEYYLTHSINKSHNEGGWIFMDYRNNSLNDKNSILYGHGRYNGTMFGELKYIIKNDWYQKSDHLIKISTPTENSVWNIFSVYHIPTTSDYLYTNFHTDQEFLEFVNMLKNRSALTFNIDLNKDDKIITLSTCYNSKEKLVVHAKLVKRSSK